MIMRIVNFLKPNKKIQYKILILICIFILFPAMINLRESNYHTTHFQDQYIKSSGIWATLDLTNPTGINNSRFTHNTIISIQGRLFNRINDTGKQGYVVAIEVDDVVYSSINDTTDFNGDFEIIYTIDPSLNIYSSHKIEATVLSPPNTVEYRTYYVIDVNTTSFFNINEPFTPKLTGEDFNFDLDGYLRFFNGTGIPSASINYYWYDGPTVIDSNLILTDGVGLIQSISIPDVGIDDLDLKLTFESPPEINYTEIFLSDTKLFANISCIWDLPTTIRASSDLIISGQVVSRTDPNLRINNRTIRIVYNGIPINTVQTESNGEFSYTHPLNASAGLSFITIELVDNLGKNIITTHFFDVQAAQTVLTPPQDAAPFLVFFSVFIPILAIVLGGLGFYGYRYYKKQDKLSKVVNLPLESKIINLKILKDTGRLEESLSYLFNAIYLDLINAKFGRTRSDNETIRDFAIISVKKLKLSPTTIYPFIQKVEEIIYAKPFQITDNEFYNTINLFSPIYFELTGYNFVLNF